MSVLRTRPPGRRSSLLPALLLGAAILPCGAARAQSVGFQINRYEPSPAGSWSFAVDHPWYNTTRDFAAGLTFNYGHNPLVYGDRAANGDFSRTDVVIAHQVLVHVDLAIAFFDRINVSLSLPVTATERGAALGGVGPRVNGAMGDPRAGVMVRLYGRPERDAFSLHLGANLWFPIQAQADNAGDTGARVLPKLVAAGLWRRLRWSLSGGYYHRPEAVLAANLPDQRGGSIGPAFQLGGLLAYADTERRFSVGPELILNTTVTSGRAFTRDGSNLEVLLSGQYNLLEQVQIGAAVGFGALRDPGTPDVRALLRLAYAPIRRPEPVRPKEQERPCPACAVCVPPPVVVPPPPVVVPPPPPACDRLVPRGKIQFRTASWELRPVSFEVLKDMARQIQAQQRAQETVVVSIEGHTDDQGPNVRGMKRQPWFAEFEGWVAEQRPEAVNGWLQVWYQTWAPPKMAQPATVAQETVPEDVRLSVVYNQWLSRKRAESVRAYLVKQGISEGSLKYIGFGLTRPLERATTEDVRALNRRVEFLVEKDGCANRR